jgi:hypothetical protein
MGKMVQGSGVADPNKRALYDYILYCSVYCHCLAVPRWALAKGNAFIRQPATLPLCCTNETVRSCNTTRQGWGCGTLHFTFCFHTNRVPLEELTSAGTCTRARTRLGGNVSAQFSESLRNSFTMRCVLPHPRSVITCHHNVWALGR